MADYTSVKWNQLTQVGNVLARQQIKDAINGVVTTLNANSGEATTGPAAGITSGTGTVAETSVENSGGLKITRFFVDLTGLASSTTDLDIIGVGASPAYFLRIDATQQGSVQAISMTCLEAPAGGVADIDLYSATEGTGVFDGAIGSLTETALITSGGSWTNGRVLGATAVPAAGQYLYLVGGAGGTAATYTSGKYIIEIYGN